MTTVKQRRGYVTGLILIGFLVTWAVRDLRPTETVQVVTGSVSRGAIVRRVVATGTLQAVTTVQVGAQVSGTVQTLHADFNSVVHAGEVIATLDAGLFDAALGEANAVLGRTQAAEAQAEADANGLEAAVSDARTKVSRAETLAANALIPQVDLESARLAMAEVDTEFEGSASHILEAKAAVKEAAAAAAEAKINRDRTTIRSPIDGIVVARHVDVGQTVAAAVQAPVLFTIAADLKELQLAVAIDESDVGGIDAEGRATFKVESYPSDTFTGTISQIRLQPVTEASGETPTPVAPGTPPPGLAGTVVSYTAIVDVANPDERLRPGMTAMVTMSGSRHDNAVRIPNNALAFQPSSTVLQVVGQPAGIAASGSESLADPTRRRVWQFDGRVFTPIDVRVGLSDGQWTELVSGPLDPGDPLVTGAAPNP